jgi:CheY-like chemotaxis protein
MVSGKRLLVIDDEPGFCGFVKKAAESLGYEVTVCSDGQRAIEFYERCRPTDIVLDVVMPEVEGIEIVRELAKRGSQSRVVLVSGYDPSYVELGRALGQASGLGRIDALTKPVRLDQLLTVLRNGK